MKNIFNIKTLLLVLAMGVGTMLIGCSDDDDDNRADALFRPIVKETAVGGQWIEVVWDRYEGAEYFELLLSGKDGLELSAETDTTFHRFDGLAYDTDYVIKIRSISEASGLMSQYYVVPTITTTDIATDLKDVRSIENMALVTWGEGAHYNNLKVFHVYTPEGEDEAVEEVIQEIPLNEDDMNEGQIFIKGLEPENSYIVRVYYDEEYLGKKKFNTKAPEDYGKDAVVYDLRDYEPEESYELFNQKLIDDAIADNPDKDIVIVLRGGVTYELRTVEIPATKGTVKITTGQTLVGDAILAVQGNLGVKADASVNALTIERVFFSEHPEKPKSNGNFGGTYLFNFNRAGASIDELSIVDCTIKYKRGICRIQTTASINNFIMDNCIIDSIAGYGVTNADNAGADIKNIKVTKSTFSHCEKLFVSSKPASKSVESFSATNCTFVYNIAKDAYMFDFSNMSFVTDPKIEDCLFGPGGNNGTAVGIAGFRAAKGSLAVDNCYATTDLEWADASGAIEGLISTKTKVDDTFKDASGSDFTLTNAALSGVVGDPRWW